MIKRISAVLITIMSFLSGFAQEFFDTSDAEKFFTFGARVGFNASNRTMPDVPTSLYNRNSWGTGFDAGVVANVNFKEYLSIQPGLFFDSRSGDYTYLMWYYDNGYYNNDDYMMGHFQTFNFIIPIMGVVKFNPMPKVKWSVEFGPYFQFTMKQKGSEINIPYQPVPTVFQSDVYRAKYNKFDFGFKMGTGIQVLEHYYLGIHYLAGVCHAWTKPSGGHNKEWMFTIGYDF